MAGRTDIFTNTLPSICIMTAMMASLPLAGQGGTCADWANNGAIVIFESRSLASLALLKFTHTSKEL